jgi:hypothetical protein
MRTAQEKTVNSAGGCCLASSARTLASSGACPENLTVEAFGGRIPIPACARLGIPGYPKAEGIV